MGPIRIRLLVVFLMGSRMVDVTSLYRVMGEKRETTLWTSACLRITWGSIPALCGPIGTIASAKKPAPKLTKKEKKIQTAREAKAEVAVLRKITEKRIEIPSQKEM